MNKKLLLLGLLRLQEMHGYQLNEVIDAHLGSSVYLTKPTAYNLLQKMTDDGWISCKEEREGNRPTRSVYAITPEGETVFQSLLRESLAEYEPAEFKSDISLIFLDALPPSEAAALLQQRREAVEVLLKPILEADDGHHSGGFGLVVEHQKRYLQAELQWLDEIIAHLSGMGMSK
jgi:DNA-binding PadR family transcriptional regulator